jgi:histidine triad (HIT) family protein
MQLTPEIKAQLEEQKKQCVYCKIVSGEIPGKTVFEDDKTLAVLDIYPAKKGHIVYALKEHYPLMPYVPGDEFKHFFGLIPQLSQALKSGMVATGVNIFIANGYVAGQQFPHVLLHMFPRESGDGWFNYLFDKRKATLPKETTNILKTNFPIMMKNHFGRHPANWHVGEGDIPGFLTDIYDGNTVIYEDEKVLCVIPEKGLVEGYVEIYSKLEEKYIENLSLENSAHLFFTASLATTLVFEGLQLGQQGGTNIIVKSGDSDDNPDGRLCVHILPRKQDDSFKSLAWQPKQPSYDLGSIQGKIKDKAWKVKYVESEESISVSVKQDEVSVEQTEQIEKEEEEKQIYKNAQEEIEEAINRIK